ncbi:MAG: hypothetical protein OIF32_00205, partial [Campylobacterales bacterium]|nr:hypothetical protein [Campylobacterales bacterium]
LVEKYPKFAYMIGEFISKNSDYNQIKYHCAPYVTYLFDKYRYGQIFIDIFTNCRFKELYIAMGEDYYDEMERFSPNILRYFLEDEKNIETYKQALFKSLKRRPIEPSEINLHRMLDDNHDSLLYNVYEDEDTGEFDYEQMQKDGIEEEFDDMKLCGVYIEEFIQNLKEEMNEVLRDVLLKDLYYYSNPVYSDTTTYGDTLDDVFYQEYDEENEYETNKEFFLEGFENGEEILAYIEEDKNPDILNTLEPTLLRKLAFEKKLYIYKRFEYYGSGGFSFGTDLEQDVSLEDILEKFIAPYYDPDSFYIQNDGRS